MIIFSGYASGIVKEPVSIACPESSIDTMPIRS